MRRLIAFIILLVECFLGVIIINAISSLVVALGVWVYSFSRVLFWVVLALAGSFGIWVLWMAIPAIAGVIIKVSEKIIPSRKGLRYWISGLLMIVVYGVNALLLLQQHTDWTRIQIIQTIFMYIMILVFSIVLIFMGKNKE